MAYGGNERSCGRTDFVWSRNLSSVSGIYEPNTPSTLTVYLARPAAAQHHARPAICSVAVSRLPIFNDSHGTSYLKICRTDLCQILGSVELRL